MLKHDDAVGSSRDRSAGHDLPCSGGWQGAGGRFARMCCTSDGQGDVRGGFGGAARVSIASGAGEGRLIVIGAKRRSKNAAGGSREIDTFSTRTDELRDFARVFGDDRRSLLVTWEAGARVEIV